MWKRLSGFVGGLYKFLWKHTFHRPWTYVMREHPASIIILFVAALAAQIVVRRLWVMLPCDFIMVLFGHTVWDTTGPYIKKIKDFRRLKVAYRE